MRIGIDARPALYGCTGIGVYVRELVAALAVSGQADRIEAYGHRFRRRHERLDRPGWPAAVRLHDLPLPVTLVRWGARVGLHAPRLLGGVDVLHLTDYVHLPAGRVPVVATVHDTLFATLPDCYTPSMCTALDQVTRQLLARATRVLVPCERVRGDLVRLYGAHPARVDVVAHGTPRLPQPSPEGVAAVRGLGRFVLALGTLEPRKNLPRLMAAMDRVRRHDAQLGLVVVGQRGWLDEPILEAMATRAWVRHEPGASRERIACLLRGAEVLAYPSLGEGFGLPVLEGAHAGVPVLVGTGTAAHDVGGEAVLAVDALSVDAIAEGLVRLLQDGPLRERLVRAGQDLAARHTWEACARGTRACYAAAVDGGEPRGVLA